MTGDVALEFANIRKSFGSKVVHDALCFQLHYGEIIGIFGRSGSGKSVLLRMAIGLEKPDEGSILFEDKNLADLDERQFYDVRKKIGYVFQHAALFDSKTVEENLAYPLRLHTDLSEERILNEVNERLEFFGLKGTNNLYPDEISGGMQKRVGLLRATMLRPKIVLFDEPTAGLDPLNVRHFAQNVLRFKSQGAITGFFVTHDVSCAFAICDRIALLNEGRIYCIQSVDYIRKSTDPLIRSFIDTDYTQPDPLERAQGAPHG